MDRAKAEVELLRTCPHKNVVSYIDQQTVVKKAGGGEVRPDPQMHPHIHFDITLTRFDATQPGARGSCNREGWGWGINPFVYNFRNKQNLNPPRVGIFEFLFSPNAGEFFFLCPTCAKHDSGGGRWWWY